MDMNHQFSRLSFGWISPKFTVVYSFNPVNQDPRLETVFDKPTGVKNYMLEKNKSLASVDDRMLFVADIARQFNELMSDDKPYMEAELTKIRGWLHA
jgi:hypothetical protein